MNTSIVTTSGSNVGIGFTVLVDLFELSMEDIELTYCLLGRRKGGNVEGGNGGRPSPSWMGMVIFKKRAGIWKYHRYLPDF